MNRINFRVFKRFWAIAKLYWFGEEKKGAITLIIISLFFIIAYTLLSVIINAETGNIISSLSEKNEPRFWQAIVTYIAVLLFYVPVFAGSGYVQYKLSNYWRRYLTNHFLNRYFSNRSFYNLGNFKTNIDNPDQRISEDIKSFTLDSLAFFLVLTVSVLQVIAFSGVLWSISPPLVACLTIYVILGPVIVVGFFGKKLVKLNFKQIQKEANFRFGLVRVRENSESIAFYRGERQELNQVESKFKQVFANFNLLILWRELYLSLFTNPYKFIPYILPAIIIAPSVFSGQFEVGKVTEAQGAFLQIFLYLNVFVDKFQDLTNLTASVNRLYYFEQYLEKSKKPSDLQQTRPNIHTIVANNRLAFKQLTLQTPNYQRTLIKNLSVELPPSRGLIIMGFSGCGKSSLLRAIAGLWNSGTGVIVRPSLDKMLFLPQRPYMILGTLRNQLTYPQANPQVADEFIYQVLHQVNLPDLAERFGGLNVEEDWADVLSLGEQQRLAFARILVNKPKYAILDEATSALDVQNEKSLYCHLQKMKTTYISVGHRPTLIEYHHTLLRIVDENKWEIKHLTRLS